MNLTTKVQRFPDLQIVLINMDAVSIKRMKTFMSFGIHLKEGEGVAEIYAFIYENLAQAEMYIVQFQQNNYFIQRLGR